MLRYYGLDLTRFSALFMTAWVDKRCPGTVFNITTLIGDDVIDSYTYRFGPSGRQRIRVPLEKAGLDGLSLTVRLDDGVKSANSSGLRLGSIALVAKPHT